MKKLIIGFFSKTDPYHDRVAWSGTVYKVREAIELAGLDVVWIPYGKSFLTSLYTFVLRLHNRVFPNRRWLAWLLPKILARNINRNPLIESCDYLFFSGGAGISIYLTTNKPIIFLADATFQLLSNYYPYYKGISKLSKEKTLAIERKAFKKASLVILSSQWALNSVVNDYHCDMNKCHVLEFGPNLDTNDIRQSNFYEKGELRVLFSGVDWERKGGDTAVETVEILRRNGIEAKLIVAGPRTIPKSCINKDYILFVGYLNKNLPDDYKRYIALLQNSHIFLLPTKAECSAIVYSEAAAAGLPTYTYLTGGTGNYVIDGVNGHALFEASSASDFANQIIADISENRLTKYKAGALRINEEKLSWEAWAKGFRQIMEV